MPLLEVDNLRTTFRTEDGPVTAVNGLSFSLDAGETLGIVGESGSGKSVTALSIMRLLSRNATVTADRIAFNGEELSKKSEAEMRTIRGYKIAMIFQDPMTSLNPVLTIGEQIAEAVRLHLGLGKREGRDRAVEMLKKVRIANPEKRLGDYPHQFSGGMRQRVMIAIALSCNPELLIADEPTTALDVTIQAQVLELMNDLQRETGAAIILITHDLGVVAEVCRNVLVMYGGNMVEYGNAEQILENRGCRTRKACWHRCRGSTIPSAGALCRFQGSRPTFYVSRRVAHLPGGASIACRSVTTPSLSMSLEKATSRAVISTTSARATSGRLPRRGFPSPPSAAVRDGERRARPS